MRKTPSRLGLSLAIGLALAIRLYVIHSLNFDGLYGQDSFAYFYHGFALWHDHALEYHWPWLPVPTRLYWPMGYPTLLALAFTVDGRASANAAQIVTLGSGLAVTALTYGLALRISGAILTPLAAYTAALCAAALIAVSGLQVQASVTIMSDAPALAWALLALWLWIGPNKGIRHRRTTSLLAGASFAAAVSTRYEYAPLLVAPLVYWWAMSFALSGLERTARGAPILRFGLLGAIIAGFPQLLYSAGYSAPVLNNEWLTGWNVRHVWQASFSTPDGVQHYSHSVGAFYLIRPLVAPESLPWILAPFFPLGLLALAWSSDRSFRFPFLHRPENAACDARCPNPTPLPTDDRGFVPSVCRASDLPAGVTLSPSRSGPFLCLLTAWWLVPTLYLVGVPFESARFALISQPALSMCEGIGLAWSASILAVRLRPYRNILATTAVVWAGCGIALTATNSEASVAVLSAGKTSDQAAISWILAHAPAGSAVATFDLTLMLYHYGNLDAHHLKLYDLSALDTSDWHALAGAPHVLVVANVGNLTRQWAGLAPDQSFLRLIEERRLQPIAEVGPYSIYG